MFNHANYNAYVTNEAAANYGQRSTISNIAFQPRTAQVWVPNDVLTD
jgi:hypothetical protein